MEKWEPNALEMMQAMFAVLNDPCQHTEAMFIHGAPARDDQLDYRLLSRVVQAKNEKFILNGLTAKQCQELNLSYVGFEEWQRLLRENNVAQENIIIMPASKHTAEESRNFLLLVKKNGWKKVAIASYPYHILRCFLQIIELIKEMDMIDLRVSCVTFYGIDWNRKLEKPVLNGQTVLGTGNVIGALSIHIAEEFKRIVAYAQNIELSGGQHFTRHAKISEMFTYLERRDK
ncbi:YdcF family protein [Candidatus Falkowbacteria bacterium]|nr:YdcF family protein [Candidatus Falkowbacteria bacterium]